LKQKKVILSELVREVVRETGLPRKIVYGTALEIKRNLNQEDKTGDPLDMMLKTNDRAVKLK
jgi:hypothetical protein